MGMPEINRRQAMVPDGADVLDNRFGTAPGLWIPHGDKLVVLLPGPPRELQPMVDGQVVPRLQARLGGVTLARRVIRIIGRTESHAEEMLQPLYASWTERRRPSTRRSSQHAPCWSCGCGRCRPIGHAAETAVTRATDDVAQVFGADVCSRDGRYARAGGRRSPSRTAVCAWQWRNRAPAGW